MTAVQNFMKRCALWTFDGIIGLRDIKGHCQSAEVEGGQHLLISPLGYNPTKTLESPECAPA